MARLREWLDDRLPASRIDLRLVWSYVLGQTDHMTRLTERVERLEEQARRDGTLPDSGAPPR